MSGPETPPEEKAVAPADAGDENLFGDDIAKAKKKKDLWSDIIRVVAVVAILVIASWIVKSNVDVESIKDYLHPEGSLADRMQSYLIFIFAMSFGIALGLPRVAVCAAGGAVYGAAIGVVVNTIASVLGSLGPYQIGKSVLRKTMKRRLGARFETWKDRFRKRGFFWTLNLRLFPAANATLTGLICGACKVTVWEYMAATALGTIPQTVIFTMLGSGATKGKTSQIVIGGLIFVIVAGLQYAYAQRAKRKKRDAAAQGGPA